MLMAVDDKENNADAAGGSSHGGNIAALAERAGCAPGQIIDFSASINPLGPPEGLRMLINRSIEKLVHYPEPHGKGLVAVLSSVLGLNEDQLVVANGSTEIIYTLPRILGCARAVIPVPSYLDYERACRMAGVATVQVQLAEADGFQLDFSELAGLLQEKDLVFLGRPNNPTGVSFVAEDLLELAAAHPATFFAVDESFFDFIAGESGLLTNPMAPNLIVFRSLTKFYAIPGLRLGFAAAAPETAALMRGQVMPWTVNTIAQEVGRGILGDCDYAEQSRAYTRERRLEMQQMLSTIPLLNVFPGEANYLLLKLDRADVSAARLADKLLLSGPCRLAVRVCENFAGLDQQFFRVAVRGKEENELLCQALARELSQGRRTIHRPKKKTPALMLQGTSSNAGKSVLTAALCRILLQDGFRVAPFKAQNMSLNSFVTRDGEEMGRAQVVQAQACRLDPDVRMNPVLLKPSSDVGSQIIVNGRVVDHMSVADYIAFKPLARQAALNAYDLLAAEYDVVVIEGAGSPAEVNLKKHDIVNMAMARHAEAPVLLVGDIDRGGVFASFIGTMEVMAEWERRLIAGYLVNRFRGQESLLSDAYTYLEHFTGKPVLGTIPYMREHGLPEEDSVSFKAGWHENVEKESDGAHVTIAVIDLPHISNFTDFEPFLAEPDVRLRVIRTEAELAAAQPELAALILPGSKNVISDFNYLRQSGMVERIRRIADLKEVEII
ncbi:MAG TPA: cobyric acid synthase, partial [Desulfobacteraceae bacterium]|nr:cobyric acid synthase [Desulfobacteraceae bacterium]